ncbi:hypothetical protein LP420_17635 [Massilia sp. B-10]|nr:hypothetical protein LP420_17635 [Massilia sp. B-10]
MPGDAELVELASSLIRELNEKYGHVVQQDGLSGSGEPRIAIQRFEPFLLLHRPRKWNARENAWIGEERKRGKLGDLNAFLRGGARERFSTVVGDLSGLSHIRYVITLDTDTQLPMTRRASSSRPWCIR